MADSASTPVKSALRTLEVIEYVVARDQPVAAQEISAALAIPVSSLSYLLNTLVEREYLARTGRRYSAGVGLTRLQQRTRGFSLAERATPLVRELRLQLNETASFFVRRGWEVEALVTETSEHALRYAVAMGTRTALHGFAAGKAILASLPDAEIDTYLAEADLVAFTSATITSPEAMRREIEAVRLSGFARTREEHSPGIQGIGCAVQIAGETVGALSVAVPSVRFTPDVEVRAQEMLSRATMLFAR